MSFTKEMLRRGFLFTDIDEMMRWKDSYHESESFAFAGTAKNLYCDYCSNLIPPGTLYSIGQRQVYVDAPLYGDWVDRVHIACSTGYEGEKDVFKNNPPNKLPGWAEVPDHEKSRYLLIAGIEDTPENRAGVSVFAGVSAVVVGEFDESKESINALIEANGGKVIANVTKSSPVTHIVLGSDGTTKYGQKTGRGSKRYKDAVKKKPKPAVVDLAWVREAIDKGVNVMAAAQPEQQPQEKKKPAAKRGTKRKATEEKEEKEETEEKEEKKNKKAKTENEETEEKEEEEEGSGEAIYDEESLKGLKRAQLQTKCKQHGLKANGTNQSMIEALCAVRK